MGAIALAILTGVVAAAVWAAIVYSTGSGNAVLEFSPLADTYTVIRKLGDKPEPETTVIRVRGNVLEVEPHNVPDAKSVRGEIVMSEQLRRSGRGQYDHVKTNGDQLFGFWDVQLKDDDTILVHTTFAKDDAAVFTGYVWSRANPTARSEARSSP